MKVWILMLLLLPNLTTVAQSEPPPAEEARSYGPGKALPENSQIKEPPNLTGLRARASFVAQQLVEQSRELFAFLSILALMFAGYHAQFRGLEEFTSTILRIVIAAALLSSFQDFLPAFFAARKELIQSLPVDAVDAVTHVGAMIGTMGLATFWMGPAGIGLALATFLVTLAILIVYSGQILFEAVLLALAPLAIACIAFRSTAGILWAWLKTFIAVLLVPVGWTVALAIWNNIYGFDGAGITENALDLIASIIYTAAASAIYMGMPIITTWFVNRAGGALAAAMPSPLQVLSGYLSGRGALAADGAASGSRLSSSRGLSPTIPFSAGGSSPTSPPSLSNDYGDRIRSASRHHKN
jgi:hypothetical protein